MKEMVITWYSINDHLALEDHGPIGLNEALAIVDRYMANSTKKFEGAEEAIAATMFGFSQAKSTFIEICVNSPNQISFKIEVGEPEGSWLRKLFRGIYRHEAELKTREEVVQKIQQFFTMSGQEIKKRLTARRK